MRLIDLDSLPNYKLMGIMTFEGEKSPAELRIVLWEDIESMPIVDAVPVVRCARCRHGEAFKTFPGGIFCPYIKDTVPPDGYCYMGEENTYDYFQGVCFNGDSPYCADFTEPNQRCREWERKEADHDKHPSDPL